MGTAVNVFTFPKNQNNRKKEKKHDVTKSLLSDNYICYY